MESNTNPKVVEHPSSAASDRTIIRAEHDRDNPYFPMRRDTAQDNRLSWEARGLLVYVLSKHNNWQIMLGDLRRQGSAGQNVTRSILRKLEADDYLIRRRVNNEMGYFEWECTIYEKPQKRKKQNGDSPSVENPSMV